MLSLPLLAHPARNADESPAATKFVWDLVRPTNDRQRQCGTPADDFEQKLPRILSSVNSKQVGASAWVNAHFLISAPSQLSRNARSSPGILSIDLFRDREAKGLSQQDQVSPNGRPLGVISRTYAVG